MRSKTKHGRVECSTFRICSNLSDGQLKIDDHIFAPHDNHKQKLITDTQKIMINEHKDNTKVIKSQQKRPIEEEQRTIKTMRKQLSKQQ